MERIWHLRELRLWQAIVVLAMISLFVYLDDTWWNGRVAGPVLTLIVAGWVQLVQSRVIRMDDALRRSEIHIDALAARIRELESRVMETNTTAGK